MNEYNTSTAMPDKCKKCEEGLIWEMNLNSEDVRAFCPICGILYFKKLKIYKLLENKPVAVEDEKNGGNCGNPHRS